MPLDEATFAYAYDRVGNITTWTQQYGVETKAYDFTYDPAAQLTGAIYRTTEPTPTIVKRDAATYSVTTHLADSLQQLRATSTSGFSPRHPEDLGSLRSDGTPWLASIAHERDALFRLSREEVTELMNREPVR